MTATYYRGNGTTVTFDRDTLELCILEYVRRRQLYGVSGCGWGRVFIGSVRVWL